MGETSKSRAQFYFAFADGSSAPLQDVLVGTFALVESTSRDTLLDAVISVPLSSFTRSLLKNGMARENTTFRWSMVADAIFCTQEVNVFRSNTV